MEGIVSRRLSEECACGSWMFEFGVCAQVKFGHCVRITNRILEKYGHTPGCIGCEAALAGGPVAGENTQMHDATGSRAKCLRNQMRSVD